MMKINLLIGFLLCIITSTKAQKIETIFFNLYTDSLKKGIHNYINVDGKLSNGKFLPLDETQVKFSSNAGKWQGNNLIIDSSYQLDSVWVTATLKSDTNITQSIAIYLKKNLQTEKLKTEQEILRELNQPTNKRRKGK